MDTPRAVARGLATGRAVGTLAAPLALHVAARIQERDAEDFLYDPTQLANALRDLIDAVDADAAQVSDPAILAAEWAPSGGEHLATALEATRRLRASYRDRVALVAALPDPGSVAADAVLDLGKQFLGAGVDVVLVCGDGADGPALSTLANVARFHQGAALSHSNEGRFGLAPATLVPLDAPIPATGFVTTPEPLARTTDIAQLSDWVDAVRR